MKRNRGKVICLCILIFCISFILSVHYLIVTDLHSEQKLTINQMENTIISNTLQDGVRELSFQNDNTSHSSWLNFDKSRHNANDDVIQIGSTDRKQLSLINAKVRNLTLKIYVYELPMEYHFESCLQEKYGSKSTCFDLSENGYGSFLYNDSGLYIHNTWQFSLEKIIHQKMLQSGYRTRVYSEANAFYVPFYSGVSCFCSKFQHSNTSFRITEQRVRTGNVIKYLQDHPSGAYNRGEMHIMALAKIEKEHVSGTCPILSLPDVENMTFIGIEKSNRAFLIKTSVASTKHVKYFPKDLIVAPYPAYGHLGSMAYDEQYLKHLFHHKRQVYTLLAVGVHKKNTIRELVLNQYKNYSTTLSFDDYTNKSHISDLAIDRVWLVTPECTGHHMYDTMKWMKNSVFCIEPPGDSPTRKSFYDAVISGCIPVIIPSQVEAHVKYPFEQILNYTDFTVTIDENELKAGKSVIDILYPYLRNRMLVEKLQKNLLKVLPYLQYGRFDDIKSGGVDAMDLIFSELDTRLKSNIKL